MAALLASSTRYGAGVGRLPLVDPDDESAPESVRAVLRAMREATGRDFNVIRATANHPAIFEAFLSFSSAAYVGNSLDPATRELAYLSASLANDCHY
jgi:alkylhydroperoxidase family enzyme